MEVQSTQNFHDLINDFVKYSSNRYVPSLHVKFIVIGAQIINPKYCRTSLDNLTSVVFTP